MKKTLVKSHTITFQEHLGGKILPRAFDTPKEHLEFKVGSNGADASHLKNLQKMPEVIRGVEVVVKKG